MAIIIMSAFFLALAITGIVTVLFIASSRSVRKFELIHWVGAILCVAVTSDSLPEPLVWEKPQNR